MPFIKTSGIGFCLLLLSSALSAQDKHTLYFRNGQKALEGRWSYTVSAFQRTNLVEAALGGMDQRDGDEDGPDGQSSSRWSSGYQTITQSIRCEGLVTAYYQNGNKRSEIRYKKGIASGDCTTYYSNGNKAWQGELSNGMRTGMWTGWYKDGKLYCKGSFEPLEQQQLEETWQDMLGSDGYSRRMRGERSDLLEGGYSDTARATDELRGAFKRYEGQTGGSKETRLVFFQKNGDTLASIFLLDGLQEGQWKLWRNNNWRTDAGGTKLTLDYRAGRLLAITGDSGRQSIGKYMAAWKESRERETVAVRPYDGPVTAAGDINGVDPGLVEAPPYSYPAYRYARADNRPPIFPGPGDMYEWIRKHLQYPASAQRDSTYGNVTVLLLLSAEGKRIDAFIQNSSGHAGLDAEALRVVKTLPDFHPATSNGKKVRTSLSVNVNFENPAYRSGNVYPGSAPDPNRIETAVDRPASFPGLFSWMNQNLVYPAEAKRRGEQGKVFVQFIVNLDGSITDVKVARSSGFPELDAEALRVMRTMPHWQPGQKDGRPVRSVFKQPVIFHID